MSAAVERKPSPDSSRPVSDAELLTGLRPLLSPGTRECELEIVDRRVNPATSSCPSEFVTVKRNGVELPRMFLKFESRAVAPREVHRRGLGYETLVNRWILPRLGESTPRFVGSFETSGELLCLVTEATPNALAVSKAGAMRLPEAAAWIGRFHARSQELLQHEVPAFLTRYNEAHFGFWKQETERVAEDTGLAADWLPGVLAGFEESIELLWREAPVIVHGEYYPHNVLVSEDRVHPIDWESAGVGPGAIDLASLTMGWPGRNVSACTGAYIASRWRGPAPEHFEASLRFARLYLCLRMLGDRPAPNKSAGRPGFFEYLKATAAACGYLGGPARG